jgi:hypothetical protein
MPKKNYSSLKKQTTNVYVFIYIYIYIYYFKYQPKNPSSHEDAFDDDDDLNIE